VICRPAPHYPIVFILMTLALSSAAAAEDQELAGGQESADRPEIKFYRWQEDWSALADSRLRTGVLDSLKYMPLSTRDPASYLSLGLNVRERFELNDAPSFGIGTQGDSYLLQRIQLHADLRLNTNWQLFAQFEDVRAVGKDVVTPVDENQFDLRQAFLAYVDSIGGGVLKVRVGRQEMAFDLQRFVSVRDGPNVRQAFDAAWLDWEQGPWRFITFWSQPVQYRSEHPLDDFSDRHLQYGGVRLEHRNAGPGDLSAYYSRFQLDKASFLDAGGDERRDILDVRYAGARDGLDWDLEAMGQTGRIGGKDIRAWAVGTRTGYTFPSARWTPRLGLQVDAASGDDHRGDGVLGTFNPLFPNGYYFTLAGYTGYVNLIHVKPGLTLRPMRTLTLTSAVGLQWRETTADAVYVQPSIPVRGTAGKAGSWTGMYVQVRAEWAITPNLTGALEAVNYQVGGALRRAGGHDANYFNVELKFGW
jgi:alginate export protein